MYSIPLSQDKRLKHLLSTVAGALDAPVSLLTRVDGEHQRVVGAVGADRLPAAADGQLASWQRRVIESGGPVTVPPPGERDDGATDAEPMSFVGVPVPAARSAKATLAVVDPRPREWARQDVRLLQWLGEVARHEVLPERGSPERAAGDLRVREERYRLVVHAANSSIWDYDAATGEIEWDGAVTSMLRYSPDEIGTSIEWWYERVHPEDRERVIGGMTAAVSEGRRFWSDEHRFRRGDGSYATVLDRCCVVTNEHGSPARVIGSMLDVTERKRAEDAQRLLASASALLDDSLDENAVVHRLVRLPLSGLADCCTIDMIDDRGAIHRVAAAHVDGAKEQLLRREACVPADDDATRHVVAQVIRTGRPVLVTSWSAETAADGAAAEIEEWSALGVRSLLVTPLSAHTGTLGALTLALTDSDRRYGPADLLVSEDLARRGGLAISNSRLYAEAREAIEARDDVLGVVTHDLRNPLHTIQLAASMLLELDTERRQETTERLELIRRVSLQMNELIQDLLDASVMETGNFKLDRADRSASDVLRDAQAVLDPLAETKQIRLSWIAADDLPDVRVDAGQIRRVFSNLVGNAIKFTPQGGRVEVRAEADDHSVCYAISDSGPGLSEDQLTRVFEGFWQARRGDRRGAGMGLVIARGIVEAHGGRIWVESDDGSGATFRFTLPLSRPQAK